MIWLDLDFGLVLLLPVLAVEPDPKCREHCEVVVGGPGPGEENEHGLGAWESWSQILALWP